MNVLNVLACVFAIFALVVFVTAIVSQPGRGKSFTSAGSDRQLPSSTDLERTLEAARILQSLTQGIHTVEQSYHESQNKLSAVNFEFAELVAKKMTEMEALAITEDTYAHFVDSNKGAHGLMEDAK